MKIRNAHIAILVSAGSMTVMAIAEAPHPTGQPEIGKRSAPILTNVRGLTAGSIGNFGVSYERGTI